MRKLLYVIFAAVIALAVFTTVCRHGIYTSSPTPPPSNTTALDDLNSEEEDVGLYLDTIMYAGGHAFVYRLDDARWGSWYYDTIHVGDDNMLKFDSVGPSALQLSHASRRLIVDLANPDAADMIKDFMQPIDGFKRFQKKYEVILDSVEDEEFGTMLCMGYFSFSADYANPDFGNEDKINRFICDLADASTPEIVDIPALAAFYAGYNPTKYYSPIYTGAAGNISALSDFIANKTFENWRRGGYCSPIGSMEAALEIRANTMTSKYLTFSKYENERVGIGHGMYTETLHTFDIRTGKKLSNKDIFKPHTLEKVKTMLFEVMADDDKFTVWYKDVETSADVRAMVELWKSNFMEEPLESEESDKDTELEEPEKDTDFKLPEGALTELGVVFSFQPYEIGCWAAGAFHFIVPYDKLMPYLTPKAKYLLK